MLRARQNPILTGFLSVAREFMPNQKGVAGETARA